ncbi:MAG: hypothetical protein K2H06_02405 [Anaeroplasmataceae bacterium]|nr:hypothetical protein [Anaeroplasmataceae bacterium]
MHKYDKKFPKKNLMIAIICFAMIMTFFIILFNGNGEEKYIVAIMAVMVLLMPIFLVGMVGNIRYCLRYFKFKRIVQNGKDGTGQIVDYRTVMYNKKKWNIRYALIVQFYEDNITKTAKTGFDFLEVEYQYLISLDKIKCKFKDNLLIVTEEIPDKIYENLTVYGVDNSKFRRVFIVVWQIIGWIGALLVFAGIVGTILMEDSLYLIIGALCLFIPTAICAIIFGIHFLVTFLIKGE